MDLPGSSKSDSQSPADPPRPEISGEVRTSVVEEKLEVGVRKIETGAVRVRKIVHEETQTVPLTVREQRVEVRRVPINRPVDERFAPRQEGDTLVIPVFEYVPVVTMQLTLKEEVHVTTIESQRQSVHDVTLNSEEIVIERRKGADGPWESQPDTD